MDDWRRVQHFYSVHPYKKYHYTTTPIDARYKMLKMHKNFG
jgi:hypothetical protein